MSAETKFFDLYDDLQSGNPYLYVELAYNRQTDWMIHIWRKNNGIEKMIFSVQELTRRRACKKALKKLKSYAKKLKNNKGKP